MIQIWDNYLKGHVVVFVTSLSSLLAAGCSSLTLESANFSWPIENELKVDAGGMIQEDRYRISFNVKPLLYEETNDSVNVSGRLIDIIRDVQGYYYLTGPQFKNVYVFRQAEGCLVLENKIAVSEDGLLSPGFNQRTLFIELVDGRDKPIMLTKDGGKKENTK
ncbi:MAG TPA: hypothetical protein VLX91_15630 [Candidatus Acidoferrales bacterium]|nr:hypothetical protein [Candidatus Acidoferrales bacterium]